MADADLCLYQGSVQIESVEEAGKCHDNRFHSGLLAAATLGGVSADVISNWNLRPGTYYVRVDGYSGGYTDYVLSYNTVAPPEVSLSPTRLTMERGSTGTYTVVLTNEPSRNVTVTPTLADDDSDVTVSPSMLTFTSANWNTVQTVTVTAGEEAETTTIGHQVIGLFLGDTPTDGGDVSVNITPPPDPLEVNLSTTRLTVDRGSTGTYTVVLTNEPSRNVTVTPILADDDSDVTVSPSMLTFTSANWNTVQTVTVTAGEEAETTTIGHQVIGLFLGDTPTDGGDVSVNITPAFPPDNRERQTVRETVAGIAAATVSNVTSNIGARFSAPTGGVSVNLAGTPVAFGPVNSKSLGSVSLSNGVVVRGRDTWHARHRTMTVSDLLATSSFEIALGASEGATGDPIDATDRLTVWGRGDFQLFESGGGRKSGYDGNLLAGYLGADLAMDGGWLVGLAISTIAAEADYTLGSVGGGGTLEAKLTNVHPYVRFAVGERTEAWAILGLGTGEVTNATQQSTSKSDMSMRMLSAGGRHGLATVRGIDLTILADGSFATVGTDDGVQAIDGISADVWRARIGGEASYTRVWNGGSALTSFLEVAGRKDGGDSAQGVGLEISPGLAFNHPESGLAVEARGRVLALHSADNHREYGASITVSKAPEAGGLGLSVAITPTWGTPDSSLNAAGAGLFPADAAGRLSDSVSLNSRITYGFAAGKGVLAPFADFSLHDGDSRRIRVGTLYSLGPSVDLELSGDRHGGASGSSEHGVQFSGRIRF